MPAAPATYDLFLERLHSRLNKEAANGCWEWGGALTTAGYGSCSFHQKRGYVHRIIFEQIRGQIADGLELDHLCRNPKCANPEHLEPVTHQVNMKRGSFGSRTHCKRGHEFNEQNTYIRKNGTRMCYPCQNLFQRERWLKWKAKRGKK